MPTFDDGSNLARHSHMFAAVADSGSEELDGAGALAQLTHGPSVVVNPWTGDGATYAQVLAEE